MLPKEAFVIRDIVMGPQRHLSKLLCAPDRLPGAGTLAVAGWRSEVLCELTGSRSEVVCELTCTLKIFGCSAGFEPSGILAVLVVARIDPEVFNKPGGAV